MKFIKKYVEMNGVKKVHWIIDEHVKNIAGTGYLVRGAYGWTAYDGNDEQIDIGDCKKKTDAVKALYKYSETIEKGVQKEKAERQHKEKLNEAAKAYGELKKVELILNGSSKDDTDYIIGELYEVEMGGVAKPKSVADYFSSLYKNFSVEKKMVKVETVIGIDNNEYDDYIENFYDEDVMYINDMLSRGGSASDSDMLKDKSFSEIHEDEKLKDEWFKSCYELVSVIKSNGRKSLIVSTHGYDYPCHIGFDF